MDAIAVASLIVMLVVAVVLAVGAVRVGMLLAPKIERWGAPREPDDEGGPADDRG